MRQQEEGRGERPRTCGEDWIYCRWGRLVVWALLPPPWVSSGGVGASQGRRLREELYWQSVKDSKNPAEIQSYIDNYPQGKYVGEARRLLDTLKPPPASASPEPAKPSAPTLVTVELWSKTPGVEFTPDQRFQAIPGKQVKVTASKEGYKPDRKTITVEARDMVVELGPLQRQQASMPLVLAKTWHSPTTGMEFVLIPAGKFMMGSDSGESNGKPVHEVRISKAFYLGKHEVTQGQWQKVMGNNPSIFKGDAILPVENVSWEDVQEFIHKLNAKEGDTKYRLPTEAEWEYAARARTATIYSFGNDERQLGEYAWYFPNSGNKTHPVGQKKPNAWGLHDMHGNVWEWVQDCYDSITPAVPRRIR